jgi:hypothetical protein
VAETSEAPYEVYAFIRHAKAGEIPVRKLDILDVRELGDPVRFGYHIQADYFLEIWTETLPCPDSATASDFQSYVLLVAKGRDGPLYKIILRYGIGPPFDVADSPRLYEAVSWCVH